MFSEVTVSRGFTSVRYDMKSLSGVEVNIDRSSVLAMANTKIEIEVPQTQENLLSIIDPAILFTLGMSRVSLVLEAEHRQYATLSREQRVDVKVQDRMILSVIPKQAEGGLWGCDVILFTGSDSSTLNWPAKEWSWEDMMTNALSFPALSIIVAMGLGAEFEGQIRDVKPVFKLTNEIFHPGQVEIIDTAEIGGMNVTVVNEHPSSTSTPETAEVYQRVAEEREATTEDDFDIAFRNLLKQNKKGGMDA